MTDTIGPNFDGIKIIEAISFVTNIQEVLLNGMVLGKNTFFVRFLIGSHKIDYSFVKLEKY